MSRAPAGDSGAGTATVFRVVPRGSGGMADAHGSGPCARKGVGVQLPPSPPPDEGSAASRGPSVVSGRARASRRMLPMDSRPPTGPGVACECRVGDRLGRSDRLRGGPALRRRSAWTSSASTTTCAGTSSAPDGSTAWSVRRLTSDLGDAYTHFDVDIRDRDGAGADLQAVRPGHRRGDPHRRPAEPRLGRQGAVHRLRRQRRSARSTCWRTPASTRSRRRSSTARPTRCTATGPTACRWSSWRPGGRSSPGHPYERRHHRGHVDRRTACTRSSAPPRSPRT